MYTIESKNQLAKLLATENLTVQHKKTATAYFNLKTRTLTCPLWKDMSSQLYDLLMGHEVGHALHTPLTGWHTAVKANETANFKSYLNVLEDARIEKKMKRAFPGLVTSFTQAYATLYRDNFFGTKGQRAMDMSLIDRLNVFAKVGQMASIPFTPEEQVYVDRMSALETWDQVHALASELFTNATNDLPEEAPTDGEPEDSDDEDDDELGDPAEGPAGTGKEDEEDSADDPSTEGPHEAEGSKTDAASRAYAERLLSDDNYDVVAVTLPTPIVDHLIVPLSETVNVIRQAIMADHKANDHGYSHGHSSYPRRPAPEVVLDNLYKEFMASNDAYVALLAKEFTMKQAAQAWSRTRRADTGDIHVSQLYRYKLLDEMIFKKRTMVHTGKSHGFVYLLDKSGSMDKMMHDAIHQLLVLALFCRQVRIPFVAYGFTAFNPTQWPQYTTTNGHERVPSPPCWTMVPGDLAMNTVGLREIINSTCTAKDFKEAVKMQLLLATLHNRRGVTGSMPTTAPVPSMYKMAIPTEESLRNTPLNEALVTMRTVITAFRTQTKADIVHLVILQDGAADGTDRIYMNPGTQPPKDYWQQLQQSPKTSYGELTSFGDLAREGQRLLDLSNKAKPGDAVATYDLHIVLEDRAANLRIPVGSYGAYAKDARLMTTALLRWLMATTGIHIFGFYLVQQHKRAASSALGEMYVNAHGQQVTTPFEHDRLVHELKTNRWLESYRAGYTRFCFVMNKEVVGADTLDDLLKGTVAPSKAKLASAFGKLYAHKANNRMLVSKFIPMVAAPPAIIA